MKGLIILVTGVRGISRIVITRFTLDTKLFTDPDNRIGDNRSDQTDTNTPHTSPTGHFTIGQPFFENIREVASVPEILGFWRQADRNRYKQDLLPYICHGHRIYYRRKDVYAYEEKLEKEKNGNARI
uniref:Uncharacterized protein n=1 Tax=uncultured Alphaproteobacteria bacterium TaxID=91750 RepID=A0A6G8F2L4_9PROT|nr:hypothetical protein PlAlph_3850 [uncultured Alphaproteobacteria bacterium]